MARSLPRDQPGRFADLKSYPRSKPEDGTQNAGHNMTKQEKRIYDKQAMALQWAIHALQRTPPEPNNVATSIGRNLVVNVMLPFATELALKGLLVKELPGSTIKRTHDLDHLFASLPKDAVDFVEKRFQQYQEDDPVQIASPSTMVDFLAEHAKDFERWRYLEDVGNMPHPETSKFQYALCAILDRVYE